MSETGRAQEWGRGDQLGMVSGEPCSLKCTCGSEANNNQKKAGREEDNDEVDLFFKSIVDFKRTSLPSISNKLSI